MYIEWDNDPNDLRLVSHIHLDVSETCDEGTILVKTTDHSRTVLYVGPEKMARTVFSAIRKRLGLNGTLLTIEVI